MASNKDLKFPAPKPSKLCRWMISMNTVGRSRTCYSNGQHQVQNNSQLSGITNLGEKLKEVATFVEVDQNIQTADSLEVFL